MGTAAGARTVRLLPGRLPYPAPHLSCQDARASYMGWTALSSWGVQIGASRGGMNEGGTFADLNQNRIMRLLRA